MSQYFDINGTAMVHVPLTEAIRKSKTKEEANEQINNECLKIVEQFKNQLQELTQENPDVFDNISFEGFYPFGLDVHCFQNHAHGPSTDLDTKENGEYVHIHDTVTLTINGTIETDDYEEHQQLFIDVFQKAFKGYAIFRLNIITMFGYKQDAIIFDPNSRNKIITVPLTK